MPKNNVLIIGIAGATASGKSLLANTIVDEIGSDQVVVISEDSYYKDQKHLSLAQRDKTNYDHPDAFEHSLLIQHLDQLRQQKPVDIPIYNFAQHLRSDETRHIGKHSIIVLEGILLFVEPVLRELMDIRLFMETPLDICLMRRLRRDIGERGRSLESVLEQYEKTVRLMYAQFIEPTKRYADLIVPHGGANRIAIDLIMARMKAALSNQTST